jgi:protein gp37
MSVAKRISDLFRANSNNLKFVSIEPIHSKFDYYLGSLDWVIIGAETCNSKGKIVHRRGWIVDIVDKAGSSGVQVFIKDKINWREFVREFPKNKYI